MVFSSFCDPDFCEAVHVSEALGPPAEAAARFGARFGHAHGVNVPARNSP